MKTIKNNLCDLKCSANTTFTSGTYTSVSLGQLVKFNFTCFLHLLHYTRKNSSSCSVTYKDARLVAKNKQELPDGISPTLSPAVKQRPPSSVITCCQLQVSEVVGKVLTRPRIFDTAAKRPGSAIHKRS